VTLTSAPSPRTGSDEWALKHLIVTIVANYILLPILPIPIDDVRGPHVRARIEIENAPITGTIESHTIRQDAVGKLSACPELIFENTRYRDSNDPPLAPHEPIHGLDVNYRFPASHQLPRKMELKSGNNTILEVSEPFQEQSGIWPCKAHTRLLPIH
jgi:hypothetical protein